MSEINKYTVGELVEQGIIEQPLDGNHGDIHPKGKDFVHEGIPFIMASDINNGEINFKECKNITKKQADSLRKGFSKTGDVLLTHKATIGRTAIVPILKDPYMMLTPQVTYYRVKQSNKLNNIYLKYYFDSKYFQETIKSWAGVGSTRAYIGIIKQWSDPLKL
jgi:type I restriction enzyme, S subunit